MRNGVLKILDFKKLRPEIKLERLQEVSNLSETQFLISKMGVVIPSI